MHRLRHEDEAGGVMKLLECRKWQGACVCLCGQRWLNKGHTMKKQDFI